MIEVRQLLATFDALVAEGGRAVLATVIKVQGSTYRLPGARMLLGQGGTMTGLVSGGCLEGDLLEHAKPVMQSGQSKTVHYDYTEEDDIVWGLGLGCAGVVDILLELVDAENPGPMELLRHCMQSRKPGFIATGISADGQLAGRWLHYPNGATDSQGWMQPAPDISKLPEQGTTSVAHQDGHVLYERIDARIRLCIFGAGPDVLPLAQLADSLGWLVEVYDHRPANIQPARFPATIVPQLCRAQDAALTVTPDERTAVLLMTHHYPTDKTLLQTYANSAARYIGALGPKRRTEMMLEEISVAVPVAKLFAPTGLDIGGEAPEDIALSIVAEIKSVFNDRPGGFLRHRSTPIHERRD